MICTSSYYLLLRYNYIVPHKLTAYLKKEVKAIEPKKLPDKLVLAEFDEWGHEIVQPKASTKKQKIEEIQPKEVSRAEFVHYGQHWLQQMAMQMQQVCFYETRLFRHLQ